MQLLPDIRCPKCSSKGFHLSHWRSHEEKAQNPGMLPYRCVDCSHRFVTWDFKRIDALKTIIPAGAILVIVLGGLVVSAFLLVGDPEVEPMPSDGDMLGSASASTPAALSEVDVPTDKEQAARLLQELQQSAGQGDSDAMIRLGLMYKNGVGILQNYDQAARWIRTAAEGGNPKGMLELGRLYRDGVGLQVDFIQAYVWFNRAAAALNLDAVRERDDVSHSMTPEHLRKAQELSAQT